jgi:diaminopimelate decarboxylase
MESEIPKLLGETYHYLGPTLFCEEVALDDIVSRVGTPCYVYSARSILDRFRAYQAAFGKTPHLICYAVKANSNLEILRLLAEAGSGFDIVSGGELYRVLKAGGDPSKMVFSGVGKTAEEIEYAIQQEIHCFNCESRGELQLINAIAARHRKRARVAFRVNPDIEAKTHPYISTGLREHKFGIGIGEAEAVYGEALGASNILPEALSCHIGSQLLDTGPILEAAERMLALVDRLRAAGAPIRYLDLGGGLGVAYKDDDTAPPIPSFIEEICRRAEGRGLELHIEPGRSIVGASGVLLTRVLYRKQSGSKEFVVVDAAMNDLLRPALYGAHHEIVPLRQAPERGTIVADVVGPVCETGDFLARERRMANVLPGDLLAVCTAGAYGFVLASNYNSRPKPCEVLASGGRWRIIRQRETYGDLVGEELFGTGAG